MLSPHNMRFRPKKLLTYLLIGISVVVILANFISYNTTTTQLQQLDADKHPMVLQKLQHAALLGPRNPNPVFFDERFKKYDDKNTPADGAPLVLATARMSSSSVGVGGLGAVSQTRIFHGLLGAVNSSGNSAAVRRVPSTQPTFVSRVVLNGSENEEYREQFVRRVRLMGSAAEDPSWNVWVAKKDRKSEIVDDRIVKQMNYVPKRYSRLMARSTKIGMGDRPIRLKTIYVPGGVDAETPLGSLKFTNDRCPVSACNITTDSVHELTADLRLLQADAYFSTSEKKPSGQIWVLWVLESPANTADFSGPDNLINWTATYRWDSTLVTPYAKFVPFSSDALLIGGEKRVKAPPPPTMARNYAANKTKMVAWFVSNCNAKNRRWEFAQELKKYIPVDIFGACGTIDCPRSAQNECNDRLNADYKFYLSFENSNCDHYVTEKFFENGLGNDVVPIVMGGRQADYLKAAPPNSYIHVDDFRSVEALAEYLLKLNASDDLYNEYFRWKGSGEFINTKFWCRLCALLHDDQRPSMWYTNFHRWWMHEGSCTTERWEDMMQRSV